MKLSENSEEIIIRHLPVKEWITGGILTFFTLVCGLFLLYAFFAAPRGYYESLTGGWSDLVSFLIFAALFVSFVFGIKSIREPLTIVHINLKTASINIIRQRIYGTKADRFYFHQIQKFKSYKGKLNFSPQYFLALVLANKKTIKLKIALGDQQQPTVKFIKKLNKFIKSKNLSNQPDERQ